jgi:hypothetical protein
MSDFITQLEAAVAKDPDLKVSIDIRVNTEHAALEDIEKTIRDEHDKIVSLKVITHGKPTMGQPELKGDGKIVVIRIEKLAKDHIAYLKRDRS